MNPADASGARNRMIAEGVAAACTGVAATAVLYSDWWAECCGAAESFVTFAFLPGFFLGIVLGGGVYGTSRPLIYVGVAIEFVAVWLVCRIIVTKLQARSIDGLPAADFDE